MSCNLNMLSTKTVLLRNCLMCHCKLTYYNTLFGNASRRTYAQSWIKRKTKEQLRKDTVFQYVGNTTKQADRVYGWGYAATGALGRLLKTSCVVINQYPLWDNIWINTFEECN